MKRFFTFIFVTLIPFAISAASLDNLPLDKHLLEEYNGLISVRHTASDYRNHTDNIVWFVFNFDELHFKNREKLPSSDWHDWVNNPKNDNEILKQAFFCYPQDNGDIITELGGDSNDYFLF